MRAPLVVTMTLALTACDLTRSPTAITLTEDRVMIQSVLVAGDSMARVLIRLIPAQRDPLVPGGMDEARPVTDAVVRLAVGGDTVSLHARSDIAQNPCIDGGAHPHTPAGDLLPGCYFAELPERIAVGRTYELIVDLPDRDLCHAMTLDMSGLGANRRWKSRGGGSSSARTARSAWRKSA